MRLHRVEGRNFPLSGNPMTVGRARDSDLLLDEQGLSRNHARIVPNADGVQIEDLGSTNGSFVNDKRVVRGQARAGDEIAFDTLRFRLVSSVPLQVRAVQVAPVARSRRRSWPWLVLLAVAVSALAMYAAGLDVAALSALLR